MKQKGKYQLHRCVVPAGYDGNEVEGGGGNLGSNGEFKGLSMRLKRG